jgi:hypothetical protein
VGLAAPGQEIRVGLIADPDRGAWQGEVGVVGRCRGRDGATPVDSDLKKRDVPVLPADERVVGGLQIMLHLEQRPVAGSGEDVVRKWLEFAMAALGSSLRKVLL